MRGLKDLFVHLKRWCGSYFLPRPSLTAHRSPQPTPIGILCRRGHRSPHPIPWPPARIPIDFVPSSLAIWLSQAPAIPAENRWFEMLESMWVRGSTSKAPETEVQKITFIYFCLVELVTYYTTADTTVYIYNRV